MREGGGRLGARATAAQVASRKQVLEDEEEVYVRVGEVKMVCHEARQD